MSKNIIDAICDALERPSEGPAFSRQQIEGYLCFLILSVPLGERQREPSPEISALLDRFLARLPGARSDVARTQEAIAAHFERHPVPPALIEAIKKAIVHFSEDSSLVGASLLRSLVGKDRSPTAGLAPPSAGVGLANPSGGKKRR